MAMQEMAMGQETENANPMQGGYCIEIRVNADGKIEVGTETVDQENAEAEDTSYQPVKSFRDAIAMAMDIYKSNGQMPEQGAQADFDEGFGPMDNA